MTYNQLIIYCSDHHMPLLSCGIVFWESASSLEQGNVRKIVRDNFYLKKICIWKLII